MQTRTKNLLKAACLTKGKSFGDLADVLGVHVSTIYYRLNHNGFTCEEAHKIADYLGVSNMMEIFFPEYAETSTKIVDAVVGDT